MKFIISINQFNVYQMYYNLHKKIIKRIQISKRFYQYCFKISFDMNVSKYCECFLTQNENII